MMMIVMIIMMMRTMLMTTMEEEKKRRHAGTFCGPSNYHHYMHDSGKPDVVQQYCGRRNEIA
jgi:hypothetical protein